MSYKSIDFTQLGGLYVYQDTLDFLQVAYNQAIAAIAASFGDSVIISGLIANGNSVSDGWVVLNGELLPVAGGAVMDYLFLDAITQTEQFDDGQQRNVYTTKRLVFTGAANNNFLFADFVRLPFATTSLKDALQSVQNLFTKLLFDEPVILSGCIVGTNNSVGTGVVYMGGKLMSVVGYSGGAPVVYLTSAGSYVTALPTAPYIKFDGGTSQYYPDVLRRKTAYTGEVVMHTNASELFYFDTTTGLGKWRWLGWKISTVLQSRVPVGYDNRAASGGDTNWDNAHRTVGNPVGSKNTLLGANNIPELAGDVFTELNGSDGTTNNARPVDNGDSENHGTEWKLGKVRVNHGVNQQPIDNRQAGAVILMIEKL